MNVLIIEDEKILSDTIKEVLKDEYEIDQAYNGQEGELYAKQDIYDVIILDLMLPIFDGYTVLEKIRNEGIFTPVLILTAKDALEDKLKGFNTGADDYLTKPFAKEELKVRIEAMIRRNNPNYYKKEIKFKELVLDTKNRKVFINKEELRLQGKQFDMLMYLIQYKDRIITKEQIFVKYGDLTVKQLQMLLKFMLVELEKS